MLAILLCIGRNLNNEIIQRGPNSKALFHRSKGSIPGIQDRHRLRTPQEWIRDSQSKVPPHEALENDRVASKRRSRSTPRYKRGSVANLRATRFVPRSGPIHRVYLFIYYSLFYHTAHVNFDYITSASQPPKRRNFRSRFIQSAAASESFFVEFEIKSSTVSGAPYRRA